MGLFGLGLVAKSAFAADTVASVVDGLHQLSIDPAQSYHVLDLQLARGDIKIYLTAGTLMFTKPVAGHVVAAVFTTANTEAGDAEVLVLPPTRGERASLAQFTKSPNLDEHFNSAVFVFSDETAKELLAQIQDHPVHSAAEQTQEMASSVDKVLQADVSELDVRMVQGLLDNHSVENGFFYGIIGGRSIGIFDVVYEPTRPEPVLVGHIASLPNSLQYFQVWSSFRPRRKAPAYHPVRRISNYRLDTVIKPDLSMTSQAKFDYQASAEDGRAINLELSSHLRVTAAQIDGKPAEFFQHGTAESTQSAGGAPLLLVAGEPLAADVPPQS